MSARQSYQRLIPALWFVLSLAAARISFAAIPVPAGLEPGDAYHLVFNSSLSTTALSADIEPE
jgi:hypothetical protein